MHKEGLKSFLEVSRAGEGQVSLPAVPRSAERGWGQGPRRSLPVPLPSRLLLHRVHGALQGRLQGLQLVHGFPQQEPGQELLHLRGGLIPLGERICQIWLCAEAAEPHLEGRGYPLNKPNGVDFNQILIITKIQGGSDAVRQKNPRGALPVRSQQGMQPWFHGQPSPSTARPGPSTASARSRAGGQMDTSHKVKVTLRDSPQPQGGLQGWHSIPCAPSSHSALLTAGLRDKAGSLWWPPGCWQLLPGSPLPLADPGQGWFCGFPAQCQACLLP